MVLTIIFLTLQSCRHTQEITRQQDAAMYNTQLGLAYLNQGDRVLAKRKLLMALKQAPNSPNVNGSMAYFMEKTGDWDKAGYFYRNALLLAPGRGAQLNNYGAFLCRRGHYKLAEHYFLLAVNDSQYEHTAAAYENAGLCAMAMPNLHKAETYFKKALMQDPSRRQSLSELVRIELKQGKADVAWKQLQKYPLIVSRDATLSKLAVEVARKANRN